MKQFYILKHSGNNAWTILDKASNKQTGENKLNRYSRKYLNDTLRLVDDLSKYRIIRDETPYRKPSKRRVIRTTIIHMKGGK